MLLVRHAATDHVGRILTGRAAGVPLSEAGRAEAAALARRLRGEVIDAVRTSPRERAVETAAAIAAGRGFAADTADALDEIDFGRFTGRTFAELDGDPDWRRWNERRATARAPEGEAMAAAQARITGFLQNLRDSHAGAVVACVSHADLIKAAVLAALGASLDAVHRLDVDPASVTRLQVESWGVRLLCLNERR